MVGMARCAVPARVVAGGANVRAAMAFEGVAPLHAARTSQRDVRTTLNTYPVRREREQADPSRAVSNAVGLPRLPHAGFSLMIMNRAAENDLASFQVPVHSAREPKTVRSPLAVKTVIELPDGADKAAHDVHRFREVNVGFGDGVIRFIHPEPPSRFVDEPVFDIPFGQVLFRWFELEHQCRASVDRFPPRQIELETAEQV